MAMKFIDPTARYEAGNTLSRNAFVGAMDKLGDLEKYIQGIDKNPNDAGTRKDLGGLLKDDPTFYSGLSADVIANDARETYSEAIRKIAGSVGRNASGQLEIQAGFVENNFDALLDRLSAEELAGVMQGLNLYETGDADTDAIIKLAREVQQIRNMDESQISEFVSKKMSKAPQYVQAAFFGYASRNADYVKRVFESMAKSTFSKLDKALKSEDGKSLDRGKIENVIRKSLGAAKAEYDAETNDGDKSDLYDSAISPYYIALAKTVHPKDKKEKKSDDDPDRIERKAARKKKGFSV